LTVRSNGIKGYESADATDGNYSTEHRHKSMHGDVMVSVIIPCRNEGRCIAACLDSILASDYRGDYLEILVSDGMSKDGTREVLEEYTSRYRNVRVIDNPEKAVSSGLNRAIRAAAGEIIIRMDAHSEYAPDYIRECVAALQQTGAANVGGAARTKAVGFIQEAISVAYHSPFAVGGARFHNIEYEGYVDTVPYGCWRKDKLEETGLFDEELVRNQDDELNLRIIRAGGRIWQSSRIRSWYQPRSSLVALFRQYSQYGYWKVRVIQKHKVPAAWRHLIPGASLAAMICLVVTSFFVAGARWALGASVAAYALCALTAAVVACRQRGRLKLLPILPLVFAVYHTSYGYGFLRGIMDFTLLRRGARKSFARVTRESVSGRDN